ncbi:GNAT family N-acetyltransferase [Francisella hispaniensis]|uniref:BioF2-like acetyltransferase domain-containing protein n=1 Tax=Francisella hispaniensis TaxID=622488 RepID=F4BH52_9GAMM|nr:GNAT family N-acetyltransferase [Francisella hispaniensis]AEE26796.1 hypothetical protein FN3523_1493 [Francisella hispaniensis]
MISIVEAFNSDDWDSIVKSFENYDIQYLNMYVRVFANNDEPILLYYDDSNTKAINVILKRDISKDKVFQGRLPENTFYDVTTPYGYGGWLVEGEYTDNIEQEYIKFCETQGFISEFTRFHLINGYESYYSGSLKSNQHNIVRSLNLDLDDIIKSFEYRVRKDLRKAIKADLDFEVDTSGQRLDDFLRIYHSTMDRNNARKDFFFRKDFFESLNTMIGNYVYFHVLKDNKVVSTELVLYGPDNAYSFLGGTDREYFSMRPNHFLKYKIIEWCKNKGLKRFVLGGGYGGDDGIFLYKRGFAPNGIYKFYVGRRIFDKNKYNRLVDIRKSLSYFDENSQFFPLYRS